MRAASSAPLRGMGAVSRTNKATQSQEVDILQNSCYVVFSKDSVFTQIHSAHVNTSTARPVGGFVDTTVKH